VRLPDPKLLLITDRRQASRTLGDIVEAAFRAGCRWASLREKDLPRDAQIALLQRLRPLAHRYGARLMLHGDPATARDGGADGVHLAAGRDPAVARNALGADALIGISVHGIEDAKAIDPGVVDYAIAGPVFETPSKPGYGPALGHTGLRDIALATPVPVIAVGGISAETAADALRAGAAGLAAMGGLMRAADPAVEVQILLSRLVAGKG
jgi:thiamine-phosphate pyrophosphorylase